MKPLLFLGYRQLINSFRRAFSSPKRIIGVVFFLVYNSFFVLRPFLSVGKASNRPISFPGLEGLHLPAQELVVGAGFLLLAPLYLLVMMSLGGKNVFRQADVDVLFPTPVDAKMVLTFRIVRDALISLLLPLIFAILTWRPSGAFLNTIFKDAPEQVGYLLKVATITYLVLMLVTSTMDHAVTLALFRNDATAKRNRVILTIVSLGLLAIIGGRTYWLLQTLGYKNWLLMSQDPVLRTVLFLPDVAIRAALAPLTGSWLPFIWGVLVLGGVGLASYLLCLRQIGYLYDMATIRTAATEKVRARQKRTAVDSSTYAIEMAKEGKIKGDSAGWMSRITVSGPRALLWKSALLGLRRAGTLFYILPVFQVLAIVGAVYYIRQGLSPDVSEKPIRIILVILSIAGPALFGAIVSTNSLLSAMDTVKPLPFSPRMLVFFEAVTNLVFGGAFALLSCLAVAIVAPKALFGAAIATYCGLLTGAAMSNVNLLSFLLAPDIEDPTQRGFRGFVLMIITTLAGGPIAFCGFFVPFIFKFNPGYMVAGALFSTAWAVLALYVITTINASLYAEFNPTD